jgi:hypothetical protein
MSLSRSVAGKDKATVSHFSWRNQQEFSSHPSQSQQLSVTKFINNEGGLVFHLKEIGR